MKDLNDSCPCNCHDPNFRNQFKIEEHSDCGICFIELFKEAQALNEYKRGEIWDMKNIMLL